MQYIACPITKEFWWLLLGRCFVRHGLVGGVGNDLYNFIIGNFLTLSSYNFRKTSFGAIYSTIVFHQKIYIN
jgi:hypothetical protein